MKQRWILCVAAILVVLCSCACWASESTAVTGSTEEEMVQYAKDQLMARYGQEFEIETTDRFYAHVNGHDSNPMTLRAFAHPVSNTRERCYVIVTEPDIFKDNYFIYEYSDAILKPIDKALHDAKLKGHANVDYPASEVPLESGLDPKDVLHHDGCVIVFEQRVEDGMSPEDGAKLVREWMKFLYPLDYEWYFNLYRSSDVDPWFTLDPVDNGFKSADDWSDDLLIKYLSDWQ